MDPPVKVWKRVRFGGSARRGSVPPAAVASDTGSSLVMWRVSQHAFRRGGQCGNRVQEDVVVYFRGATRESRDRTSRRDGFSMGPSSLDLPKSLN